MDSTQLERYRRKIAEFSTSTDIEWWKPTAGRNKVRILPGFGPGADFFKDYYCSFEVGKNRRAIVGRKQFGDPNCPLEKYLDLLRSRNDEVSKRELAKIVPKRQVAMFLIDRAQPEKGPMCWSTTPNNSMKVMQFCVDPSYGDITTVMPDAEMKGARDIIIMYTPKEKSPTGFAKYEILPDASPSPLGTPEQIEEWTACDLFVKHKIGEAHPVEWIEAVINGTEDEFIAARKAEKSGVAAPTPPAGGPNLAPWESATVSYPPEYNDSTKFWQYDGQAVREIGFPAVCELVKKGADPNLMNYDQQGGWKKASEKGIVLVAATMPPPPFAPLAPAAPNAPAPPSMPSESAEIARQAEELKAQLNPPSTSAVADLKKFLEGKGK